MSTRFYLPTTGVAAVSPAYSATWEDTSIAERLRCVTTRINSPLTTIAFTDSDNTDKDILIRQYVSDPIQAQTIPVQNVLAGSRIIETSSNNNMRFSYKIFVVSNDGSTVRGTIQAHVRDGTEAPTAALASRFNGANSTQVVCEDGDRIVIEVGLGGDPEVAGNHNSSISLGDDEASDLDPSNTNTAAGNPYVNFDDTTIAFQIIVSGNKKPRMIL